jgi:acetyl-CoA acetyltransferase
MAWITGVGLTAFGRQPGVTALQWQADAANRAMIDGSVGLADVDGLIVGYATTLSHLMPANLLAEHLGLKPRVAFGMNVGGATGVAMLSQAASLIDAQELRCVLVAAGENRATGQSTDTSMTTLAQVGHGDYEVPIGANVPGYYALLASAYLHRHGLSPESLAPLAVQMRAHAVGHEGAQFRKPIVVADVLVSTPIADPLRLLDCCPVSDGGAAVVVTAEPMSGRSVRIAGLGQAHLHQHISEASLDEFGAGLSARRALDRASIDVSDVDVAGIYDSFTVTIALLLEEIGFAEPGRAGALAANGHFDRVGALPLNTHGGLLSYGHSGVAGGMAHLVEVVTQLRGEAAGRQASRGMTWGLVHADGGVMSAHVTAVLHAPGTSSTAASADGRFVEVST